FGRRRFGSAVVSSRRFFLGSVGGDLGRVVRSCYRRSRTRASLQHTVGAVGSAASTRSAVNNALRVCMSPLLTVVWPPLLAGQWVPGVRASAGYRQWSW